ncbi:Uu.00g063530.m01.CDS01 [Anthostomella pinea]|uniref:Uu.00g063530.m01.CDS01 n=1 Tax=Anthostomella pinea TaxID=933095 RepID=A0AAI8YMZ5_9PEZI|nr:Uu.00g063530.m01.CDS01 [Anthostomella pinea]
MAALTCDLGAPVIKCGYLAAEAKDPEVDCDGPQHQPENFAAIPEIGIASGNRDNHGHRKRLKGYPGTGARKRSVSERSAQ